MWAALRRFGPDYCDLPTMLSNVSSLLRILALNIDGRNKKRIPIVYVITTAISFSLYMYGYVFSGFWFPFWRSRQIGDVAGAFIEFSLNIISEITIIKLFYLMFNSKKMQQLTNKYLETDARIVPGSRYAMNMQKNLRNIKLRAISYWLIIIVDATAYIVRPFFMPGRHLTMDSFVIYGLEPMFESPNFEIATVIMTIAISFICYTVASMTCFFILIIGYIEAQVLSLSEEMRHLWDDAEQHYRKVANSVTRHNTNINKPIENAILNYYVRKHLSDIVATHAMAKSNFKEIEDLIKVPNAIGFLLLIMGLISQLLGGLEQTYLQLPFTMLQLSIDCYLGQRLIDSNKVFEEAVYDCKWEMFNNSNRKMVLTILTNAQKTMTLTAGGMATLSFVCLMSIIKTTYSAYTTMRSMI